MKQITLTNISESTFQEIFDWVAFNLLKQGRESIISDKSVMSYCAYRGSGGLKCGMGFCITDEEYSESMEQKPIGLILRELKILSGNLHKFANDLQNVHDEYSVKDWKLGFRELAREYRLNDKVLDLV